MAIGKFSLEYNLTLSIIGLMRNNNMIDFFAVAIVITPSIL
jgi:hypothetical protein